MAAATIEDWWATRLNGPVLDATGVGAITHALSRGDSGELNATYGLFHEGVLQLVFTDANGDALPGAEHFFPVSPDRPFTLPPTEMPSAAAVAEVSLIDAAGDPVGVLDRLELAPATAIAESPSLPAAAALGLSYPNPFNAATVMPYTVAVF